MVTKQEIQTLLNEAIKPLETKIDTMTTNFIELKKSVEFLDKKCEDVLSQLRLANERNMQQSQKLNESESALENERKKNQEATANFESLAQYLRRDCLEISGIPLSEDYSTNDIVIAVGKAINVSVKEEDISTSHPLPSYNSDAPPKIIVKFTRRDVRNVYYASRRKLIKIKTNELPDVGVTERVNIYISESLTPFKKKLFGAVNSVKKRLRWKHIWTQNGRIFVKEAERSKPIYIDSYKDLEDFKRKHGG